MPRTNRPARRIFLVGPMGAGKSSVGRHLAARLGMDFVDLDRELEQRSGAGIPLIFELEGEAGFRRREAALLEEMSRRDGVVLATGGGCVLRAANRRLLARSGLVIYLETTVALQLERLKRDQSRPLLATPDRRARLEELAGQRNRLYEAVADITVPGARRGPEATTACVLDALRASGLVQAGENG